MLNAYKPEIVLNRLLIALLNIKHRTGVHTQTHTHTGINTMSHS